MSQFYRIELESKKRSFLLVQSPTLANDAIVRAYHEELLSRVSAFDFWYLPESDAALFDEFRPYYQAVADRLKPRFDVAMLTPASRHQFFIATAPVPHPDQIDQVVVGLAGLHTLMGLELLPSCAPDDEIVLTSGDANLDALSALLSLRPDQAQWLSEAYSRSDVIKLIAQTSDLLMGEEAKLKRQQEKDRQNMEARADHYALALRQAQLAQSK